MRCRDHSNVAIDHLGNQLEAVNADIKMELAPTEERRDEIIREWKEEKAEAAKERRQQWIGGRIVVALLMGWYVISR